MRENHSVTGALDCTAGPESSGGSIIFEGGDVERHRRRAVGIWGGGIPFPTGGGVRPLPRKFLNFFLEIALFGAF